MGPLGSKRQRYGKECSGTRGAVRGAESILCQMAQGGRPPATPGIQATARGAAMFVATRRGGVAMCTTAATACVVEAMTAGKRELVAKRCTIPAAATANKRVGEQSTHGARWALGGYNPRQREGQGARCVLAITQEAGRGRKRGCEKRARRSHHDSATPFTEAFKAAARGRTPPSSPAQC